jgi:hypothetical protein
MKTSGAHRRASLALALCVAAAGCATVSGLDGLNEGDGSDGGSTDDATVSTTDGGSSNNNNNGSDSGSGGNTMDAGGGNVDASFDAGKDTGPPLHVVDITCKNFLCGYDGGLDGGSYCCWDRGTNSNSVCDLVDGGASCKSSNNRTQLYCDSKDDCPNAATPFCCLDTNVDLGTCGTATTCMSSNHKTLCRTLADCPEGGATTYTQCAQNGNEGNVYTCK